MAPNDIDYRITDIQILKLKQAAAVDDMCRKQSQID